MKTCIALVAAALMLPAAPALAQDGVERNQTLTYGTVEMMKFKPGTGRRIQEIEEKYLFPAGRKAGLMDPVVIHLNTGEWDAIYFFPTKLGLSVMEYRTSPEDVAFMAELAKLTGGKDKAEAMMKEWGDSVVARVREAGHVHPVPK